MVFDLQGNPTCLCKFLEDKAIFAQKNMGTVIATSGMHNNQGLLPDSKVLKSDMSETHVRSVKPWKSNHPFCYT